MNSVGTVGRPKRLRLGQNFLVDTGTARRIVDLLDDEPQRVLEIGPGRGALTEPLLERFAEVRALELEILHEDGLTVDWSEAARGADSWQVASNLPYSVGTAILRRLLPRCDLFSRLVVMLQREVAERVVARPGESQHGLMALERAAWATGRIAFTVHPRSFRPVPKVTSAVLVLDLRPPPVAAEVLDRALRLAGRALTRPRKMLSNAVGRDVDTTAIVRAGLDPAMRPGTVSLDGWLRLASQ